MAGIRIRAQICWLIWSAFSVSCVFGRIRNSREDRGHHLTHGKSALKTVCSLLHTADYVAKELKNELISKGYDSNVCDSDRPVFNDRTPRRNLRVPPSFWMMSRNGPFGQ